MNKILVIEDDARVRTALCVRLKSAGYETVAVSDGRFAADMMESQQPDAVIIDISMPGKDGFEVAEDLRANPMTAHLPFIFLTASHQPDFPERALALGATAFVRKPYDAEILLSTLRAALGAKAA